KMIFEVTGTHIKFLNKEILNYEKNIKNGFYEIMGQVKQRKFIDYIKLNSSKFINLREIVDKMRNPFTGLKQKNRVYKMITYKRCFIGSEVVTWIIKNCIGINNRKKAIELGKKIQNAGFIEHVLKQHEFKDQYLFYRFTKPKKIVIIGGGFAGSQIAKRL